MSSRDISILRRMVSYCQQISQTSYEFDDSKERFLESATFRNAVCLCLLQIGELVAGLSDDFKENHPDVPWREIKLLRNIVAHRYGQIDSDVIWEICLADVPELMDFGAKILEEQQDEGE